MKDKNPRSMDQSFFRGQSGQTLVEMAILIPIVIILIVGIVDFGRILMTQHVVTNAAREGARLVALGEGYSDVKEKVVYYIREAGLDESKAKIYISGTWALAAPGTPSTVTVNYPIDSIVLKLVHADNTFSLNSTSQMLHE
jgi:Flp pilus assembly protein TadG